MLSKLEGMITDGRISNAQRLFDAIKEDLPVQVRIIFASELENKKQEVINRNRERRLLEKQRIIDEKRAAFHALFRKEV